MSATATLTTTMTELKTEPVHSGIWPGYGSSVPLSNLSHTPPTASQTGAQRPRPTMDATYQYPRYSQDAQDSYDRSPHSMQHQQDSYAGIKRTFQQSEQPHHYEEIVQNLNPEGLKTPTGHQTKFLSFKRTQNKNMLLDKHGRVLELSINAELTGMFFLSDQAAASPENGLSPELTCYRRNLFQIQGHLWMPRGQLSVPVTDETGETVSVPVTSTELTISAIESNDGHPVRLVVIPWKTPPPNAEQVPRGADQEPSSIQLIPFSDDGTDEVEGEYTAYPIGWRRLQFRIATANNGRRKELQQHFVLYIKVTCHLANNTKAEVVEIETAPIVVRGRSPRNFQSRKEIPLVGSSAASRGQALVENGMGIAAGPFPTGKDMKSKGASFDMPAMRSNSYSDWGSSTQLPLSQMAGSATTNYAQPATHGADPYPKLPLSGGSNFPPETQELGGGNHQQSSSDSIRAQYPYSTATSTTAALPLSASSLSAPDHGLSVPRYVDNNPRSTKRARNDSHPSMQSPGALSSNESVSEYRYGAPGYVAVGGTPGDLGASGYAAETNGHAHSSSGREYYPSPNSWTTTAPEPSTPLPSYHGSLGENRSYGYTDQYKPVKSDQTAAPSTYNQARAYSWNTA